MALARFGAPIKRKRDDSKGRCLFLFHALPPHPETVTILRPFPMACHAVSFELNLLLNVFYELRNDPPGYYIYHFQRPSVRIADISGSSSRTLGWRLTLEMARMCKKKGEIKRTREKTKRGGKFNCRLRCSARHLQGEQQLMAVKHIYFLARLFHHFSVTFIFTKRLGKSGRTFVTSAKTNSALR